MATPLTANIMMVQPLVGAMICILGTMREEIPILTLIVTRIAGLIATIALGLEHDTGIISAQMSWKFIMKCLLETGQQQKTKETRKTTVTTTNQRTIDKQQQEINN